MWDPSGTLEKPEKKEPQKNRKTGTRDLSGTLGKLKKWDTVTQWGPKIGKAGPNVTLEKFYNCKSTFIYLLFPRAKGGRI